MNIPELFIRRPVMTTLVTLAVTIFGIMAYRTLPVSDLPNVDFPTIQISANFPGASPETMASSIATPIEQQLSTIAGIESMTSSSVLGSTQITLQFSLDRDIDAAAQDVQAALSAVQRRLPRDMPNPPSFRKSNPSDDPILLLAVSSPNLDLREVNEYAENLIAQRISMVEGVAQVQVMGAQKFAVRVKVDPLALAARGMSMTDVRTALEANNVNMPGGTLNGASKAITLQATGQLKSADGFRDIVVSFRNGAPVRLGDVANVVDGIQADRAAAWFTGERAIILIVQRQPGTNTINVVDAVKNLLPSFESQLPSSVRLNVVIDRSLAIRESVAEVKFTLVLAICLVVLVIFLFLRSISATVIPSIAMPIAVIGTFAVMYFCGFSIDNLSLLALTLSVGFVVDDAIVMLENIIRHIEHGESPMTAALKGSREIGFTIISMTISLVAVFIPVLFMGGVLGRLLNEFAVTISTAILVSGFVSLTLTPMLCSRFLRPIQKGKQHNRMYHAIERMFQAWVNVYERTLRVVMRRRTATLLVALATVVLTIVLIVIIPKGFIPSEDTGRVSIGIETPQDASFEALVRYQRAIMAVVERNPHIASFSSYVGVSSGSRMFAGLKPHGQRPPASEIVQSLRADLAHIPGIRVFPQVPPIIRIGSRQSSSVYQYTIYGPNLDELFQVVPGFVDRVKSLPQVVDVTSDLQITSPQLIIDIDRNRAAALGLNVDEVENTLYSAYGSRQVSTIYTPSDQYFVILELQDELQREPASLSLIHLRNKQGKLIPLDAVAKLRTTVGPLSINHLGQAPAVTVTFNLAPGVSLSQVTSAIQKIARDELPSTLSGSFQGTAAAFTSSLQGLGVLLIVAVLTIYLVLGVLYEDFVHPITILSGLPSATFGALATLMLLGHELNIYGYVGLILLIGIVKKNAIMMIDFALDAQRNQGKPANEAIFEACLVRFRPIMMTTVAALAGIMPIALGWGPGAEGRRTLGIAVVGGLLVSQVLTLYITPVFYLFMERFAKHLTPAPVPLSALEAAARK